MPIIGSFSSGGAFGRRSDGSGGVISATGGSVSSYTENGVQYTVHTFTSVGSNTFTVTSGEGDVEVLLVGGGGAGGGAMGGGGGAGGVIYAAAPVTPQSYSLTVGSGGTGGSGNDCTSSTNGSPTEAFSITAKGGGFGCPYTQNCTPTISQGANGGGGSTNQTGNIPGTADTLPSGIIGQTWSGNRGGSTSGGCWPCPNGGGAGAAAGGARDNGVSYPSGDGGAGAYVNILGTGYYWGGGGGGCGYNQSYRSQYGPARAGNGGTGGGGGGADDNNATRAGGYRGLLGYNEGTNGTASGRATPGGPGGTNTGSGGGGGGWSTGTGGTGGSGIIIVRYPSAVSGASLNQGTQASPIRNAIGLKSITTSGNYWVQTPQMSSAVEYYIDASTNRGPWIRVFLANTNNYNTTSYSWSDAQTSNLLRDTNKFMYCFCNPNDNTVTQPWEFSLFYASGGVAGAYTNENQSAFENTPPMGHGSSGTPLITKVNAIRLSDNSKYEGYYLRTGFCSFSSNCDDNRSGTWGQICLKNRNYPNTGAASSPGTGDGGLSDFPHYSTFAASTQDDCAESQQSYSTTKCTDTRRFAVYATF